MTHHKTIPISLAVAAMLFSTMTMAQPKPYYGPLLYSMPWQTSVPPVDSSEPAIVTTGYLWLDGAMRLYPGPKIDSFIYSLTWGDTMKTFASVFYQAQDFNPLAFFLYSGNGLRPNPYKAGFSHEQVVFERQTSNFAGDTGRTGALLTADIIADVLVGDTICVVDPTAHIAVNQVLVNSTIIDEIKGKKVPLCVGENMRARRKGNGSKALSSGTIPWATYAVPADSGTCLQFEYSPYWHREPSDDGPKLVDSKGGWWVKPNREYIVLLNFVGISADSAHEYFTLWPGPANPSSGNSGCMYPVINGIVQDPYDDFGLGGTNLPVAQWKAALRARINKIVNP